MVPVKVNLILNVPTHIPILHGCYVAPIFKTPYFSLTHQSTKRKCKENKFLACIGFTLAFTDELHCANSETGPDFVMFAELKFRNVLS